jgi:ferredoxin-NADP reductase
VDDAMLREAGPPAGPAKPSARTFVCGSTPFVGAVTRLLVDQGHDPRTIRVEEFGATGSGHGDADLLNRTCRT